MASSSPTIQAMVAPVYLPGQEPLPPGYTAEDRAQIAQMKYWQSMTSNAMEFCPTKCALSGAAGFALGGFFSLLSSSLSVDDPLRRSNLAAAQAMASEKGLPVPAELSTAQQTKEFFKETGRGMFRSAKGFGKVGALYAGIECCIEGYRAKNDLLNPVYAGFLAGGILARGSGPKAMVGGGIAFAAFSGAIDLYLRKEPKDEP